MDKAMGGFVKETYHICNCGCIFPESASLLRIPEVCGDNASSNIIIGQTIVLNGVADAEAFYEAFRKMVEGQSYGA